MNIFLFLKCLLLTLLKMNIFSWLIFCDHFSFVVFRDISSEIKEKPGHAKKLENKHKNCNVNISNIKTKKN